jgi:RNA-directed DNA polymerase
MDLEKFFDRVNHALLMGKLAQKIEDAHVLKLIRRYLEAGMMQEGLTSPRAEGAPQGGPLSPLLSNIVLYSSWTGNWNGAFHAFCRYADDCNVYVRSQRAGERVLASLTRFISERLKLQVNAARARWTSRGGVSF